MDPAGMHKSQTQRRLYVHFQYGSMIHMRIFIGLVQASWCLCEIIHRGWRGSVETRFLYVEGQSTYNGENLTLHHMDSWAGRTNGLQFTLDCRTLIFLFFSFLLNNGEGGGGGVRNYNTLQIMKEGKRWGRWREWREWGTPPTLSFSKCVGWGPYKLDGVTGVGVLKG